MKDVKVRLFAYFAGLSPENMLPSSAWRFLLCVLLCVHRLMGANWKLLVKAWPGRNGAPVPLQAVMDLLANLFNAEMPTSLPVRFNICGAFSSCAHV
jgi:hypothetical protein